MRACSVLIWFTAGVVRLLCCTTASLSLFAQTAQPALLTLSRKKNTFRTSALVFSLEQLWAPNSRSVTSLRPAVKFRYHCNTPVTVLMHYAAQKSSFLLDCLRQKKLPRQVFIRNEPAAVSAKHTLWNCCHTGSEHLAHPLRKPL